MTEACAPVVADLPAGGWAALGYLLDIAPGEVEHTILLAASTKSTVFRIEIADGRSCVLKRHRPARAEAEAAVYRDVLDPLALTPGGCLGLFWQPGDEEAWLAMTDAGDERVEPGQPVDGCLAAEWLAGAHLATAELVPPAGIPCRDARFYWSVLATCLARLETQLERGERYPGAGVVIGSLLECLRRVETRWSVVEDACAALPPVLVHGDFVPKNLALVRSRGLRLWPLDWETPGWGSPAPDLAELANGWPGAVAAYVACMASVWPPCRGSRLSDVIGAGRVLRLILATHWGTEGLANRGWTTIFGDLGTYVTRLEAALSARPWS